MKYMICHDNIIFHSREREGWRKEGKETGRGYNMLN